MSRAPRMGSVRTEPTASVDALHRRRAARKQRGRPPEGVIVLDAVYLAVTLALFALVALVAKGVEKL